MKPGRGPGGRLLATVVASALAAACARNTASSGIVIGAPYELHTLDPHAEDTLSALAALGSLYEPLVTADAELRIGACLATSWESPDALTWIFHLRPSVRFHSGRALEARDVVYSLRRLMQTPGLGLKRYVSGIASVREKDERTVEVKTREPTRTFLNQLRLIYIVPEGADSAFLRTGADGTGPFALEVFSPGASLRLVRNAAYWGPRAALGRVEYRLGQGRDAAARGLLEGRYAFAQFDSRGVDLPHDRFSMQRRESLFLKYLAFDLSRDVTPYCSARPNPFKDARVRQAVQLAIDRRQLTDSLSGEALPASQPVPRSVFGFNPGIPVAQPNAAAARGLLRQAGLGDGFAVTLLTRRILEEPADIVRKLLAPVGITVEVKTLPDAAFFEALNRRDASFWLNRHACLTGDASEALTDLFHSKQEESQLGISNDAGLALPDLDRAIEQSAALESTAERQQALQAILERVTQELFVIPLFSDGDVYALARGLAFTPRADGFIRAQDIEVLTH